MVTVEPIGERLTKATFHEQYPCGILIERLAYGDVLPTGAAA